MQHFRTFSPNFNAIFSCRWNSFWSFELSNVSSCCKWIIATVYFLFVPLLSLILIKHTVVRSELCFLFFLLLQGIVVGILAIVLSKNKKSRGLVSTITLFFFWVPKGKICRLGSVFLMFWHVTLLWFPGSLFCLTTPEFSRHVKYKCCFSELWNAMIGKLSACGFQKNPAAK